ncbi:MAG: hypothetical protein K9G28_04290 [Candidatus Nanopelagicales bacterium]|nr:hypothetical protein [Candidatus Nanopelagicales bacterium]
MSRSFLAASSALVLAVAMLVGATVAAADSVQVQSYQRTSQAETCDSPPESLGEWRAAWADPYDPISGPAWHPSWEWWANGGNGGWTCTRSITWARTPATESSSSVTYAVGDIGPGGGLVFYIDSVSGLRYEMAPKSWGANETSGIRWCSDTSNSVATGTALGTGSANTTAMLTSASPFVACTSSAPNAARAYAGGGFTDWFLPSTGELNAMCNYSRNPSSPATGSCTGSQDATFASGAFGFSSDYWSSSQYNSGSARAYSLSSPGEYASAKTSLKSIRPIRAF